VVWDLIIQPVAKEPEVIQPFGDDPHYNNTPEAPASSADLFDAIQSGILNAAG
jgi:hypothetical protein